LGGGQATALEEKKVSKHRQRVGKKNVGGKNTGIALGKKAKPSSSQDYGVERGGGKQRNAPAIREKAVLILNRRKERMPC